MNLKRGIGVEGYHNELDNGQLVQNFCSFLTGCCIMFSSEVLNKVGLWDESYFMYCEDFDYSIRLWQNGISMLTCPKARLLHKVGGGHAGEWTAFNIYYSTRNRLLFIKKHSDIMFITAIHFAVITRLIRMLQLIIKRDKKWKFFWYGIKDGLRGISGRSCRSFDLPAVGAQFRE